MWTRQELKDKAKAVLRISYWKAFLVSLILTITGGNLNGTGSGGNSGVKESIHIDTGTIPEAAIKFIVGFGIIIALFAIIFVLIRLFVGFVLEVGGRKFYIRASEGEVDMAYIGEYFKNGAYFNVFKTMFIRGLYIFLWFLLLIIPGIIKMYAYKFVPYILADNPEMDYQRVLKISQDMTMGHKWDMFVLDLSFIGWYILGSIVVIGGLFVQPYYDATAAELYITLRKDAVDRGIASYNELNMFYKD